MGTCYLSCAHFVFLLFTTLLEKTALRNIHSMDQSHEELYHFGNLRNANSEAEHHELTYRNVYVTWHDVHSKHVPVVHDFDS